MFPRSWDRYSTSTRIDRNTHPGKEARAVLHGRREWLMRSSQGFGMLALTSLLHAESHARLDGSSDRQGQSHFEPKVKQIIFLFMDGGPSQVDTFDPKPLLVQEHGRPFPKSIDATQFDQNGTTMASPFRFSACGQSGLMISELFPELSKHADDLCIVRSMRADFSEHSQACFHLHSGYSMQGRPSLGSWIGYGLGTENRNLPEFVVLNGGVLPIGGVENFSNGFLPATHQATLMDCYTGAEPMTNLKRSNDLSDQTSMLRFVRQQDDHFLNRLASSQLGEDQKAIEAAIRNYETACLMQQSVPEAVDLSSESANTLHAYGVDSKDSIAAQYAKQCLLARRLVERGVRFVEVTCAKGIRFVAPWDDHEDLEAGHRKNALVVDRPVSALLDDLKARGLWDNTLVLFAGEFGRTPFAQGSKGRDHNPQGFSIWLAGGAVLGGMAYGATDEFGYRAVENPVTIHDLHATILHLLGMDHERLTYRWGGRDFRLTDVYGNVMHPWLA